MMGMDEDKLQKGAFIFDNPTGGYAWGADA
jgi:hypothetical protein